MEAEKEKEKENLDPRQTSFADAAKEPDKVAVPEDSAALPRESSQPTDH